MAFDISAAVAHLRSSHAAIESLVAPLGDEEAAWKPALDKWSILEVVNHLADEEVEDFRARLGIILSSEELPFTPIDPPRWVASRGYASRDLQLSLRRFQQEREHSLAWLAGLQAPDLERMREHPAVGRITGRQMLASWVAHDLLHVRQIVRLRYERLAVEVAPLTLDYAGRW